MTQRVAFGSVAIVAIVLAVVMDVGIAQRCRDLEGPLGALLRRGSVIPAVWLALVLASAVELNRIFRLKAVRPHTLFAYLMIVVLVLTPWASSAGWMGHGAAEVEGLYWLVVWLLAAGVGTSVLALIRRDPEGLLRDVGATWFMIVYLGFFGAFALQLRCGADAPRQEGAWLLLILVLVTKASDIGAYFVGLRLGRHKLCPSISPGKSIEGAAGGLLASALVAVLMVGVYFAATRLRIDSTGAALGRHLAELSTLAVDATRAFCVRAESDSVSAVCRAILFGLAMSTAGQVGDLVESCFKRDAGIKDSGKVIPRFGGILDMIDSPLFAVPIGWFLLTTVWNVV